MIFYGDRLLQGRKQEHWKPTRKTFFVNTGTYPNRNTGVQGTNSSVDSGFGSLNHASGSTAYNNMVSSVTPSQTRNF